MQDLVLLVADKNMHFALEGALQRPDALDIRPVEFKFDVHSGRDGGARKTGPQMLALRRRVFSHALLVLDFEGSGTKLADAGALEGELDDRLGKDWGTQDKAIVIEPELDIWMWGSDNLIETVIGRPSESGLRPWLRERGFEFDANDKPKRPKEALETVLLQTRQPRSSALYQSVASKISLRKCTDGAFQRLRHQLVTWFPK